jgi:hypothetical protein
MTRPDGSGEFFIEGTVEQPRALVRTDGPRGWILLPLAGVWKCDGRVAELAWDSSGIEVTRDQARLIAARWGVSIPGPAEWPGR